MARSCFVIAGWSRLLVEASVNLFRTASASHTFATEKVNYWASLCSVLKPTHQLMTAPEHHVEAAHDPNQALALYIDNERHFAFPRQAFCWNPHRALKACGVRMAGWVARAIRAKALGTPARLRVFIFSLFCATMYFLAITFFGRLETVSKNVLDSSQDLAIPPIQYQHVQTMPLRRPPKIDDPFRRERIGGQERLVPDDIVHPFVFSAVGFLARKEKNATYPAVLLFLYSQGTLSWTGPENGSFNMNVTSCLVGKERFPIIFNANGLYTCSVPKPLSLGEKLSLVVPPTVWEVEPDSERNKTIMEYMSSMPKLEDGSFVLDSDVTWDGKFELSIGPEEARYKVCMMTQEKVFPEYIPEWIAYHRRIGVDYVYIYDNCPDKKISRMFANEPDVEVVYWPWSRSQIQAQNHFLLVGRRRCQWAVMIDVDEYVMIRPSAPENGSRFGRNEKPLKRYLRKQREPHDYSQIRLMSVALGSSGHIYRPREPIAEAYWHISNIQDNLTKPIVWLGHTMPDSLVHHVRMAPSYYSHTTKSMLEPSNPEDIGLCHMKYRSWEDYVRKGQGGRNSFQVRDWTFSTSWSIHSPSTNHIMKRNAGTFVEFRNLWRRVMTTEVEPPELEATNTMEDRYSRIVRPGFAWKRRRGLDTSTLVKTIVEKEKYFRKVKDWEIAKQDRLKKMGIEVEL